MSKLRRLARDRRGTGAIDSLIVHREIAGLIVLGLVVVAGFFVTRAAAAANWIHASRNGTPAYLVCSPSQLVGVVSRERLAQAVNADILNEPVASLPDARLLHGHIDHPADIVLDRLAHSHGMLPIVSREHARRTLGVVTVDHIWRFMQRRRAAVAVQSAQPDDYPDD